MRKIQVIDLSIGNINSIQNMFRKIGCEVDVITKPEENSHDSLLVLAGVGAFDSGITHLQDSGWFNEIKSSALDGQHILGICLGMQLLCVGSAEGVLDGIGLIPGYFSHLRDTRKEDTLKVPHMGWNHVVVEDSTSHLKQLIGDDALRFYFVHSFEYRHSTNEFVIGHANYRGNIAAIIEKGNVLGVQFHPEKSHRYGMKFLSAYMESISA